MTVPSGTISRIWLLPSTSLLMSCDSMACREPPTVTLTVRGPRFTSYVGTASMLVFSLARAIRPTTVSRTMMPPTTTMPVAKKFRRLRG